MFVRVIVPLILTVLGSGALLFGQFGMLSGEVPEGGLVLSVIGLMVLSSGILPFQLPGLGRRREPYLVRARGSVVINGFRADQDLCRVALGLLVICWVGGVIADTEGRRTLALAGYLAFWPIFLWLVFAAGGLYGLTVDRGGLFWHAGGLPHRLNWKEATIRRTTDDAIEFSTGERLPLKHFAVDAHRFADAVRALRGDRNIEAFHRRLKGHR